MKRSLYRYAGLFLLAASAAKGAEVFKAKLNTLDLDSNPSIVTNVTFSGLASSTGVYTKAETDAKIVELAPPPGNYSEVSNRAMTAIQSLKPATNYVDLAVSMVARNATNYTDKAISDIPSPDFTISNQMLVGTIRATAPAPGNYSEVSNKAMTAVQSLQPAISHADTVVFKAADDATNYTNKAISEIPGADFSTNNQILVDTIKATAPPPGDYSEVSNKAMTAIQTLTPATNYADHAILELARTNSVLSGGPYLTRHQSLEPATNYADGVAFRAADDATNYTNKAISEIPAPDFTTGNAVLVSTIEAKAPAPGNYSTVSNKAMTSVQTLEPSTNYTDFAIVELARTNSVLSGGPYLTGHQSLEPATNYADAVAFRAADDATNYTDSSMSSGNPAFVNAVTNCPVVIAPSDESTLGEFGGYGTIGALLAALAAAITWLKTHKADKSELSYSIVTPTVTNGEVSLVDRAINVIPQAMSFSSVLLPAGTSGKARDLVFRFTLSADAYVGFSSVDSSGAVVQWLKGDPSGRFSSGESMIGISEVSQGTFSAYDMFALEGVENALNEINNGSGS